MITSLWPYQWNHSIPQSYKTDSVLPLDQEMDGQTKQKRRLVAKKRLVAGGRLGLPHPDETINDF
jgi:hypothetical protein